MNKTTLAFLIADDATRKELTKRFPDKKDELSRYKWNEILEKKIVNVPPSLIELHRDIYESAYNILLAHGDEKV